MTETPYPTSGTWWALLRPPFGRRGLVIAATAIIGGGMALNWSWLTAIGAAPLILAVAPCALMCATGYCVMCKGKSCDSRKTPADAPSEPND